VQPAAQGLIFEPLGDLHVHLSHRQLDLELAIHVGVLGGAQLQIAAVVLEPVVIHLVPMTVGRQIAALGGSEVHAHRGRLSRGRVLDGHVDPGFVRAEDLHPGSAIAALGLALLVHLPHAHLVSGDLERRVRAGGDIQQ